MRAIERKECHRAAGEGDILVPGRTYVPANQFGECDVAVGAWTEDGGEAVFLPEDTVVEIEGAQYTVSYGTVKGTPRRLNVEHDLWLTLKRDFSDLAYAAEDKKPRIKVLTVPS